jgi:hypothetical protein
LAEESTPFYTCLRLFEQAKQSISGTPWERARQSSGWRRESWNAKISGRGRQALPRRRRTSVGGRWLLAATHQFQSELELVWAPRPIRRCHAGVRLRSVNSCTVEDAPDPSGPWFLNVW